MGLREGRVFVIFPEIPESVLNSWERATGDKEREVSSVEQSPQSSALGQGREQASKSCREIPIWGDKWRKKGFWEARRMGDLLSGGVRVLPEGEMCREWTRV